MLNRLKDDKEFWGPISIALGVTALSNGVSSLISFINTNPTPSIWIYFPPICVNLIFGLAFIVFGLILSRKDLNLWVKISITAGFSIFFVGIRIVTINCFIGWILIIVTLILIGVGFCKYFKNKV